MKKRIVVVDDDEGILDALGIALRDEGYRVVAFDIDQMLFKIRYHLKTF